jgi:hypothetical protein
MRLLIFGVSAEISQAVKNILTMGGSSQVWRSIPHKHQTVTVLVSETTLAVEFDDGDPRVICRTSGQPVRSIKGLRPRIAAPIS